MQPVLDIALKVYILLRVVTVKYTTTPFIYLEIHSDKVHRMTE
jgi:hypothetical protein